MVLNFGNLNSQENYFNFSQQEIETPKLLKDIIVLYPGSTTDIFCNNKMLRDIKRKGYL